MTLTANRPAQSHEEAAAAHAEEHHGRRWWVLAVLAVAQLMVVLDTTIVSIALPDAQSAIGFSDSARQWVVTSYALAFGGLLLLGGRLGDLFGRKRVLIGGAIAFGAVSALGGASQNVDMLIVSRALQGVAGALTRPGHSLYADDNLCERSRASKSVCNFRCHRWCRWALWLVVGRSAY